MTTSPVAAPLSIGETTKRLTRRQPQWDRFPEDFMFQLNELAGKVHGLQRKVSVHERNIAELVDSMAARLATPPRPPTGAPSGL